MFVFASGAVIITGAKNKYHIIDAFRFITKILCENYNKIVITDIKNLLERDDIQDLLCMIR